MGIFRYFLECNIHYAHIHVPITFFRIDYIVDVLRHVLPRHISSDTSTHVYIIDVRML